MVSMERPTRMSDGKEPPNTHFVYEPLAPEIVDSFVESILIKIQNAKSQNKKLILPLGFEMSVGMDPYHYRELKGSTYLRKILEALPELNPDDFPQTEEELTVLSKSRKALLEKIGIPDGNLEIIHAGNRINIGMGKEFHHIGKTNLGEDVFYHKISNDHSEWMSSSLDFFTINITEAELKEIVQKASAE